MTDKVVTAISDRRSNQYEPNSLSIRPESTRSKEPVWSQMNGSCLLAQTVARCLRADVCSWNPELKSVVVPEVKSRDWTANGNRFAIRFGYDVGVFAAVRFICIYIYIWLVIVSSYSR